YEIADIFRDQKGKAVIMGGFHPSFMPEEALRHCDAVCIGEAEPNLKQMIEDFSHGCLKPRYQNGMADLDSLVPPPRELIPKDKYLWTSPVQATRGCKNQCTFCSISAFYHNCFRHRPVEDVIREIGPLGKNILFLDDNLTTDADFAKELFARMIPLKKKWSSQCSVSIAADKELLDLAQRSGCIGLFIGLESIEQKNLDAWQKGDNRAQNYACAIKTLHRKGIGVYAGMVFGNDADDIACFRHSLDFLLQNNVDALQATILTPFPGTPLYERMDDQQRIFDNNWAHYDFKHVVFHPKNMSKVELETGHRKLLKSFYARRRIMKRLLRETAYLPLRTLLLGSLPLNLSYRYRLISNGVIG
ncbi:MAG: radical SAM protein, partial [Candidatus Cloacimonadaceae bacterium]|nr:radical SAM protein [Candidatus Cloacimonadaceae bacterium]